MIFKKLSAAICSLFIAAAFTVGAFAVATAPNVHNTNKAYGNLSNNSESTTVLSETTEPNTYYVDVFGQKPICNEVRYYKECMSFTAYYKGEAYDISIWVDKNGADNARLFFIGEDGKDLTQNNCEFISQNTEKISRNSENTAFKIVFKNNALNVNNTSLIANLDRIDNINALNASKAPAQNVIIPVTPSITEAVMTEEASDEYIYTDIATNTELLQGNSEEENTEYGKKGLTTAIIVIIAVVVVIIAVVISLFIFKKKASSEKTRNLDKQDIPVSHSNQRSTTRNTNQFRATDIPTQNPQKSFIDISGIPTAASAPIKQTYTADAPVNENIPPKAPKPQKQNLLQQTHNHIINMLFGKEPAVELPSNCVPVYITNIYELNISDAEKPKLATVTNARSADYIVLAGKYLYINPLKYNGTGLKAYSSIKGISRCFSITDKGLEIQPLGQKIDKFAPAGIEQNPSSIILVKKGKISVE